MSKSNKYGYVGVDIPAQSFGNNKGVFNPAEINELVADNKWTSFGQLELIETQTVTSGTSVDFTNIKEDIYNVHFVTINNADNDDSSGTPSLYFRYYESGVLETASVYQFARQVGRDNASFAESRSTSLNALPLSLGIGTSGGANSKSGGYQYIYNAGDSSKYTFSTHHNYATETTNGSGFSFGSGVLPQTSTVNGLSFTWLGGQSWVSGTISLYGIKEYS